MRDGAAERRLRRHLGIDVDEVVVAGSVGEGLDGQHGGDLEEADGLAGVAGI